MHTAKPTSPLAPKVRLKRPVLRVADEHDWPSNTPQSLYARIGRRCVDAALFVGCFPFAVAPMLLIATINVFVTGSVRKIFYVQERVGLHGKIFLIYKFRTMRDVAASDMQSWSSGQDQQRVTWFGRFLRSSHLDELPQLINVAKGDMSFIGPRPEMVAIEEWAAEAVPGFITRLSIRPGITGFAQITQGYTPRDREAYQDKLDLCLSYNQSMSFAVDLSILWHTALWMLQGKGWQWQEDNGRLAKAARTIATRSLECDVAEPAAPLPSDNTRQTTKSERLAS